MEIEDLEPACSESDLNEQLDREFDSKDLTIERIGAVDQDNGRDEYVLVTRRADDLTAEAAQEWLLRRMYRPGFVPGSYFCCVVDATLKPNSTNAVICIIQHRYDI